MKKISILVVAILVLILGLIFISDDVEYIDEPLTPQEIINISGFRNSYNIGKISDGAMRESILSQLKSRELNVVEKDELWIYFSTTHATQDMDISIIEPRSNEEDYRQKVELDAITYAAASKLHRALERRGYKPSEELGQYKSGQDFYQSIVMTLSDIQVCFLSLNIDKIELLGTRFNVRCFLLESTQ